MNDAIVATLHYREYLFMNKLRAYSSTIERDFRVVSTVRDCCIVSGYYVGGDSVDCDLMLSAARGCAHLVTDEHSFYRYVAFLAFNVALHSAFHSSVISAVLADKLFPVFFEKRCD